MKEVLGFALIMNGTRNKKTNPLVMLDDILNGHCSLCCQGCFPPIICLRCQSGLREKFAMLF